MGLITQQPVFLVSIYYVVAAVLFLGCKRWLENCNTIKLYLNR